MQGQKLNLKILVGPFQPDIFCDLFSSTEVNGIPGNELWGLWDGDDRVKSKKYRMCHLWAGKSSLSSC